MVSVSAYLDGELEVAEAERVDAAAGADPDLAGLLGDLRDTRRMLRRLEPVGPEAGFSARVVAAARRRGLLGPQRRQDSPWPGRVAAAAVLLLAASVGVITSASIWGSRPADPSEPGVALLARASREGQGGFSGGPAGGAVLKASKVDASSSRRTGGRIVAFGAKNGSGPGDGVQLAKVAKVGKDGYGYKRASSSKVAMGAERGTRGGRKELEEALEAASDQLAALGLAVGDKRGIGLEEVRLEVADLQAARRQVQAYLTPGPVPMGEPSSAPVIASGAMTRPAGQADGRAFRWYQPNEERLYVVVSGDRAWLSRLSEDVGGLRFDRKTESAFAGVRSLNAAAPGGPAQIAAAPARPAVAAPRPVAAPSATAPQTAPSDPTAGRRARRPVAAKPTGKVRHLVRPDADVTTVPVAKKLGVLIVTLTVAGDRLRPAAAKIRRLTTQTAPASRPAGPREATGSQQKRP